MTKALGMIALPYRQVVNSETSSVAGLAIGGFVLI